MTGWIWAASVIALVALLVYVAIRVVRGVIRIFMDFSDLASVTATLDSVQATRDLERPRDAVLRPWREVKADFDDRMQHRTLRAESRRATRLARARALVTADLRDLPAFFTPRG